MKITKYGHACLFVEEVRRGIIPRIVSRNLEKVGITFRDMPDNVKLEFKV